MPSADAAKEITTSEKRALRERVVEKIVPETNFGRGGLRGCLLTLGPPGSSRVQTVQRSGTCSRMRSTASWTRSPLASPVSVSDIRT